MSRRVGVIGRSIGPVQLKRVAAQPEVGIIAVADLDWERARTIGKRDNAPVHRRGNDARW